MCEGAELEALPPGLISSLSQIDESPYSAKLPTQA